MDFQFDSNRPIYLQLIEHIEMAIATGIYIPGERLPSVREMAAKYSVNPNTMQRAFAELEETGLLTTVSTSGRFVTKDVALISKTKRNIAVNITTDYSEKMHLLGFKDTDISEFYKTTLSEKES